ncbi:MAG: AAA family ATPase [Aurantimonas endophytica]|uniref:AAA family ATPase n=1 Tax=Aurantimonas endophytica TaxID=1522175 RepID=UPI0030013C62
MYLRSLKLTDFAGISSAELTLFEPGLNVIVGDNEAGKSTLLTALRAVFFQRHRATGEAVKALAPYQRQARPEIHVDFKLADTVYSLRKAFLQRPEAELTWPGGSLTGDAVEERLAELFRFAHPGRGESKLDSHQGAFGLLWVEQGRSNTGGLDIGVGKDAVTASLEGEVGQILGGERGRAMIGAAKTLHDRFFTDTGRVAQASPVRQAEQLMEDLRRELATKTAARADFEEKLQRLDARRATLRSYERDDAVAKAEAALDAAEERARQAAGLEGAAREAERELQHSLARRDGAAERLRHRDHLTAAAATARQAAEAAAAALLDIHKARDGERAAIVAAEAERAAAKRAAEAAEAADDALRLGIERARIATEAERLDRRLREAREIETRLAALQADSAGPAIDAAAIKALEAAERKCRDAAIRLSVTAPVLIFAPSADRMVRGADGTAIAAGAPHRVTGRESFELDGFGSLTVEPGGDAAMLRRECDDAEAALAALLGRLGVVSIEESRARASAAENRRIETATLKAQAAALLPEGRAAAEAALAELATTLASSPAPAPDGPPPSSADQAAARAARNAARTRLETATATLERLRRAASDGLSTIARAEADDAHRRAEAERLRRELAEAGAGRPRPALAEDLAAAELDRAAKAAVVERRQRDLAAVEPETVQLTLEARRRALAEIRRTVAALKEETLRLEGELEATGATALGEDVSRLEGEIGAGEARLARLRIEAAAAAMLHATLIAAQREAREHWLGPIKTQVTPYLKLIHPGAVIELDDSTLEIRSLHRAGIEEDFKRLSAGAREQVAVVTRLALAQVLKKGGHPTAVILDDALVNTDEKRLERMHLVLRKASETLQIIVLTCRERDFRDLGAPIQRL